LDEKNPYIREWSILAIRNLMEGNEENQEYVKGMQLQGAVPSKELSEMGLEAQVVNGKIRVSRRVPTTVEETVAPDSSATPASSLDSSSPSSS
jgi:hypothetical protein